MTIYSDRSTHKQIRPEIRRSWDRCESWGLKPYGARSAKPCEREKFGSLAREHQRTIQACETHLESFLKTIEWVQLCFIIQHHSGAVLSIEGADSLKKSLAGFGVKKGALFLERNLGASAPSICLFENKPCCVSGGEHYIESFQSFLSIAAPVYLESADPWGCISLWLYRDASGKQIAPLLVKGLENISHVIRLEQRTREFLDDFNRWGAALDTMKEGILQADAAGYARHANRSFLEMLNETHENVAGVHVKSLFPILAAQDLRENGFYSGTLTIKNRSVEYNLQVIPLIKGNEKPCGAVLKLHIRKPAYSASDLMHNGHQVYHDGLIAVSHASRKSIHIASITADSRSNILLQGETGTGKEVFARYIHRHSKRRNKPFIPINCAAIPTSLAESELFGYEAGAFTGADPKGRKGKFELADTGTLFLDEVNSLDKAIQTKLLRVIESQEVMRLGGRSVKAVSTRIIAASSRDLREEVQLGRFLPELLYRINAITINIPPLRERKEDIVFLANHFLRELKREHDGAPKRLGADAQSALESYDWPGNIRELRNACEYVMAIIMNDVISVGDLPLEIVERSKPRERARGLRSERLSREKEIVMNAIQNAKGNMTRAAQALGISRSTLYRKIRIMDI